MSPYLTIRDHPSPAGSSHRRGEPERAAWHCSCSSPSPPAVRAAGKLEYNRDVRPILAENCFACHGPDSAARKADLRLDRREAAIESGAITPGDPEASELIARINADQSQGGHAAAVAAQDAHRRAERHPEAMDRGRGRVSTALVAHPAQAARASQGQGRGVGPQPDRPVRPGQARGARACARPRRPTGGPWPGGSAWT